MTRLSYLLAAGVTAGALLASACGAGSSGTIVHGPGDTRGADVSQATVNPGVGGGSGIPGGPPGPSGSSGGSGSATAPAGGSAPQNPGVGGSGLTTTSNTTVTPSSR